MIEQDGNVYHRLNGANARFFHEVSDAHRARIIKVDLPSDLLNSQTDEGALARAQFMEGKLILYRVMRQRLKLAGNAPAFTKQGDCITIQSIHPFDRRAPWLSPSKSNPR